MVDPDKIGNPSSGGNDNSFVNKDSEEKADESNLRKSKKKKKSKGSRRFKLNDSQKGPNAAEVAEALGGGDDFFIGDNNDNLY